MTYPMHQPDTRDWAEISTRLQRCARALTGTHDEAADLTQQTLATLLARRPERADHIGYARTTMLRLWLDRQRTLRRRLGRLARLASGARPWHIDPESADDAETLERLHAAARRLPPRQRAVLVLRLVEGLEYTAIAEALDCSVGAVRANLHLARASVRRSLGETP